MISELLARGNRLVRPADAAEMVLNPSKEFARLAKRGVLLRLATGYFVIVPEEHRSGFWRPTIEGVALGMAIADYGREHAALMGVSAARILGFAPRAAGVGVVASEHQRPAKITEAGRVQFVRRDIDAIDLQVAQTDLVAGLVTTPEQTALDIADRPELGGIAAETSGEALAALVARLEWGLVVELAVSQRKIAAVNRLAWVASAVDEPPPVPRARGVVGAKGLRPIGARPAAEFGIKQ